RLQAVVEAGVVAEHDSLEDRAPFSRETGCRAAPQPRAQAVAHGSEPASSADDVPLIDAQDDMDSLTPQPAALVEAVLRAARQVDDAEQADDGALRWCASERQLELNRFLDTKSLEAPSAGE